MTAQTFDRRPLTEEQLIFEVTRVLFLFHDVPRLWDQGCRPALDGDDIIPRDHRGENARGTYYSGGTTFQLRFLACPLGLSNL